MMSLVLVFALSACQPPSGAQQSSGGDGGKNVVNIGYSGPLSGGAADYGQNALNGIELAVKEINDHGGFEVDDKTYSYNLKALDDKYQPSETAKNGQKFVQQSKAPIVFTSHSGGVLALQEFNESSQFIVAAYTSEPQVTASGNPLTVRLPPSYDGYIDPFANFGMEQFGKKLGMLPTNSAYGKAWTELFKKGWQEHGGEVVAVNELDYNNDTSFNAGVSKTLSKNPDVLFVGGPSEPTALVIKEARQLGFEGGFAIMDQAKFNEIANVLGGYDMLNGSVGVMPLEDYEGPSTAAFIKNYKAEYGEVPGWEAAWNYMAVYAFSEAMKLAGTVSDAEKIRAHVEEGMKQIPEAAQVAVLNGLSDNGGWQSELTIAEIKDGEVKRLDAE